MYSKNPKKYARLAQPYLEDIQKLEEGISEYLGLYEIGTEQVDIRLRLLGPVAKLGIAPASLLSNTLDRFRLSVRSVFVHLARSLLVEPERRKKADQLCEFTVAALLPGSLQVGLNLPYEPTLFEDEELLPRLQESIKLLLSIALWAERVDFEEKLASEVEDETMRLVLLHQAEALAPKKKSGIDIIEFYGRMAHFDSTPRYSTRIRDRLRETLAKPHDKDIEVAIGSIRELDLDKRTFHLRQREQGLPAVRCKVFPGLLEEVFRNFGKRVRITGRIKGRDFAGHTTEMEVGAIELHQE
ncbi:MAG TPA: hypothetical protein VNL38_01935 [Candidatus Nitrosotenuis sp.]|nr:hypothetical protein [Candidatus Nitrosotenuis sp.]